MSGSDRSRPVVSADVHAAITIALRLGLTVDEPLILHDGSSRIVRLADGGPVARVGGLTAITRDLARHYAREVDIAGWLADRGAPVVAPWDPAGPFEHDGRIVTLWRESVAGEPPPGEAAGHALRKCHEALLGYRGELPPLSCLFDEAASILAMIELGDRDRGLLHRALERVTTSMDSLGLPEQPLHGDAGMGNVLSGGVWNDWEDCCIGPVLWDLACLVASSRILNINRERAESALTAYGDAPGLGHLEAFVRARGVQVVCWSLLTAARADGQRERTERRLDWLRAQSWAC